MVMKTGYFFDMDGTLYNNTFHSISNKTFKALHQLQDQNNKIVLATSRCLRELDHLPRAMYNFSFDARILDGGALILDKQKQIIDAVCIEHSLMHRIETYCLKHNLLYRYSTKDGNYFGTRPTQSFYELEFSLYLNTPVYKPYQNDNAYNVLVCYRSEKEKNEICHLAHNCGIVLYPECIELRANKIDKASAIRKLKKHFQLERIICFGDGENDIEMIKMADVGIAMNNGCEKLKQVADHITASVDKDGIYEYLLNAKLVKEV